MLIHLFQDEEKNWVILLFAVLSRITEVNRELPVNLPMKLRNVCIFGYCCLLPEYNKDFNV